MKRGKTITFDMILQKTKDENIAIEVWQMLYSCNAKFDYYFDDRPAEMSLENSDEDIVKAARGLLKQQKKAYRSILWNRIKQTSKILIAILAAIGTLGTLIWGIIDHWDVICNCIYKN